MAIRDIAVFFQNHGICAGWNDRSGQNPDCVAFGHLACVWLTGGTATFDQG